MNSSEIYLHLIKSFCIIVSAGIFGCVLLEPLLVDHLWTLWILIGLCIAVFVYDVLRVTIWKNHAKTDIPQ